MAKEVTLNQNLVTGIVIVVVVIIGTLSVVAYDQSGVHSNLSNYIRFGRYKNGTYEAVGKYISPGGDEELGVTLTLKNNVVVDAEVDVRATLPASKKMQEAFARGYKEYVVGKNIDEISMDVVSGSSLTPKGFTDALEKIKLEAKA